MDQSRNLLRFAASQGACCCQLTLGVFRISMAWVLWRACALARTPAACGQAQQMSGLPQ